MKTKLTILILSLTTCGLISFAQQNNPTPAEPAPQPPPADTKPADPKPADTKPAQANPAETKPADPKPAADPSPVAPEKAVPADPTTPGANQAEAPGTRATTTPAQAAGAAGAAAPPTASDAAGGAAGDVVPLIVIEDVPLTDAIRNLARQSNLNFQFDPRVASSNQPTISIRFENVTAQEALNAVLDNYNLTLIRDQKSKIARVTVKDPKAEDPLIARVVQLKYSDPTNLVILAKSTLSQRSTVVADGRTSQLIITTTEREMDNVVNMIKSL